MGDANVIDVRGYVLDVGNLPQRDADLFRARAWLLNAVGWGSKERLIEVAGAFAASAPKASLWMGFAGSEGEKHLLTVTQGKAAFEPSEGRERLIAKRYALDKTTEERVRVSLGDFGEGGTEVLQGSLRSRVWFDGEILKQGEIGDLRLTDLRIDKHWYLYRAAQDKVRARADAHDLSMSAVITEAYLAVRRPLLANKLNELPPVQSPTSREEAERPGRVFLSLPPWFAYELQRIATTNDRSQGWVLEKVISHGMP